VREAGGQRSAETNRRLLSPYMGNHTVVMQLFVRVFGGTWWLAWLNVAEKKGEQEVAERRKIWILMEVEFSRQIFEKKLKY
jgi:hypothetical protein